MSRFQLTETAQLQTSAALTKNVYKTLSNCPTEYYIIVDQPGVSSSDFSDSKTSPTLARNLSPQFRSFNKDKVQSPYVISDLIGQPNTASWKRVLAENCFTQSLDIDASTGAIPSLKDHQVLTISFPSPSKSSRAAELSKNDAYLASVLDLLPTESYTVLYITSPSSETKSTSTSASETGKEEGKQYEMDSPLVELMHQELKRDLSAHAKNKSSGNVTLIDGPLFDRYQFFSPGIFMGLVVLFLILSIAYVGLTALTSLQVTYAAFDKESGPLAGKKTQ